jgi:tetratricopeptide (TPR) repeat protein
MSDKPLTSTQYRALGTWVFGSLFFLCFVGVFVFAPETLPEFKQRMLAIFTALLAGIFGYFLTGDLGLHIQSIETRFGVVGVKASGGIAAFVFVLVWWLSPLAPVATEIPAQPVQEVTVSDRGMTVVGDMTGSTVVTGDHNVVTRIEGIDPKEYRALAKDLGVAEAALSSFFKILEQKEVPPEDLDSTLRTIAMRYKGLDQKLATFTSEDPEVTNLKQQAREALEVGDFVRTERLLTEAKAKDIEAAKVLRDTMQTRLLSAAESAAELGDLQYAQLAYGEAADYYREAAGLVPEGEKLTRAEYLNQEGSRRIEAGHYRQAEAPFEQALAMREQALGEEHPDVAASLNNLAELYRAQGRYVDAEPLYERAVAIWEKVLGTEYLYVAQSLYNLALLYLAQGRYAEAEPLMKRTVDILQVSLGEQHPGTVGVRENYEGLLEEMGKAGSEVASGEKRDKE